MPTLFAYFKSIRQFFHDPGHLTGIGVIYVCFVGFLALLAMTPNLWISSLLQFIALMNTLFFNIMLFLYAFQKVQPNKRPVTDSKPCNASPNGI